MSNKEAEDCGCCWSRPWKSARCGRGSSSRSRHSRDTSIPIVRKPRTIRGPYDYRRRRLPLGVYDAVPPRCLAVPSRSSIESKVSGPRVFCNTQRHRLDASLCGRDSKPWRRPSVSLREPDSRIVHILGFRLCVPGSIASWFLGTEGESCDTLAYRDDASLFQQVFSCLEYNTLSVRVNQRTRSACERVRAGRVRV